MMIFCKQCAVKAHLPNGKYIIEITIPARRRKAIKNYIGGPVIAWDEVNEPERKIKAITTTNFKFRRFYNLYEKHFFNWETGKMNTYYLIGPCVTR